MQVENKVAKIEVQHKCTKELHKEKDDKLGEGSASDTYIGGTKGVYQGKG
jgi:hypothetical protein